MRNVEIEFLMTSLDSEASFTTSGVKKENRLIFTDDDNNKHYIIIDNEVIEYHKRGSMNMKYVFNLEHNTNGTYEIDGNTFVFVIETKELLMINDEIIIKYDLLLDDEIVNKSTLIIKYS